MDLPEAMSDVSSFLTQSVASTVRAPKNQTDNGNKNQMTFYGSVLLAVSV
jgi:hypothetical protein